MHEEFCVRLSALSIPSHWHVDWLLHPHQDFLCVCRQTLSVRTCGGLNGGCYFLQVIHLEKITSEMGPASQANVRLTSLKKTLATTLSPRVLLPAINKTYKQIEKNWKVRLYRVLDLGGRRCGTEIFRFSLKEEYGYLMPLQMALMNSRSSKNGHISCVFSESHGPVYERLARAHWGDEEGGARLPPAPAHHVLPGGPGLPHPAR